MTKALKKQESQVKYETESWKIEILMKQLARSYLRLYAVKWNAVENIKHWIYLNLSKNTIKIKHSSVFFSLFVSAVDWSALLLFTRLSGLDC